MRAIQEQPLDMIGHERFGSGPVPVMILNDWLCDTSTWDGARAYLDVDRFTWIFADLRGYGRSMGLAGSFTVTEAAADVIALADALGWHRFAIVGHSMSTLIALHLAQHFPERIERAVVLTPPPPTGMGADEATLDYLRSIALGDDATRLARLEAQRGERLSKRWIEYKVARWRATSDPQAVAGYSVMFARDGLPNPSIRVAVPVLAVTGEQDAETMRREAVEPRLATLCDRLTVISLADSGHYPMQETPPRLVAIVEHFLAA